MEENVVIVNEDNEIIGVVPRSEMRAKGLLHRSTYIIIFNSAGEVLIQKRSQQKDVYPGYFDPTTGGVVIENETYEENATRELEEELGIIDIELKSHMDFYFQDAAVKVWGRVFSTLYDGPIRFVDGEVDDCFFLKPDKLNEFLKGDLVMPDGKEAFDRCLKLDFK